MFDHLQETLLRFLIDSILAYRKALGKDRKPILLIMDGHKTHLTPNVLSFCSKNSIHVFPLPPHTSHVVQPLDVGVFNSYKSSFRRAGLSHRLKHIDYKFASEATRKRCLVIGKSLIAVTKSCTPDNISSAFWKTGIYPVSFERFVVNCDSLLEIPPGKRQRCSEIVAQEELERLEDIENCDKFDITTDSAIVTETV